MNKIWVLQNAQPENLGIAGQVFQGCGLEPRLYTYLCRRRGPPLHGRGYRLSSFRRPDGRVRNTTATRL